MIFISLLIAAAMAIAGSAAYFSVYGLAHLFSGVFWSVVVMGSALEAGKLISASYLYRYWNKTNIFLKSYLMAGTLALMILTSTGIFGYLSSGYQQDILPLKQKTEQVNLLEDEKTRDIARKKQIDDLLAGGTQVTSVNRANGTLDPNAARVLRETTRQAAGKASQFKAEQEQLTKRVADLDAQLLTLKQDLIATEAHIGPITYIAKAFGLDSDDATKYLIFIIIFSFDPMAVALTLAVNIALRIRDEEKVEVEPTNGFTPPEPMPPAPVPPPEVIENEPWATPERIAEIEQELADEENAPIFEHLEPTIPEPAPAPEPELELVPEEPVAPPPAMPSAEKFDSPLDEEPYAPDEPIDPPAAPQPRIARPYANLTGDLSQGKLKELVDHYRFLKAKVDMGDKLTRTERGEYQAIEDILRRSGYTMYL